MSRHPDEIWEHKKGRIWLLVKKLTQEKRALLYANKVLQARVRRLTRELEASAMRWDDETHEETPRWYVALTVLVWLVVVCLLAFPGVHA